MFTLKNLARKGLSETHFVLVPYAPIHHEP